MPRRSASSSRSLKKYSLFSAIREFLPNYGETNRMSGHRNKSPGKIDFVAVKQITSLQFTRTCDRCTQHTSKSRIFGSPKRNAASSRGDQKFDANDSLTTRMAINTVKPPGGQAKRRIIPLGNRRCRERIHVKNESQYGPKVTRVTLDRKKNYSSFLVGCLDR